MNNLDRNNLMLYHHRLKINELTLFKDFSFYKNSKIKNKEKSFSFLNIFVLNNPREMFKNKNFSIQFN